MNTTACKRLFSLGCVPHTDGAVFQGDVLLFLGASVTHGALPWRREEEPRRVALFAYTTRSFAGAGRPFEGARL